MPSQALRPLSRPLVIGHRGAPGHRPEHTRSAYRLALETGADAIEPDVVVSRDGVLVVRHENELSSTTDVAGRAEFAGRRTRKTVDGAGVDGWFVEDFTWAELSRLRARERMPALRPGSAAFDDAEPILRLSDVLALVDAEAARLDRAFSAIVELKHVAYFSRLGHDLPALLRAELADCGWGERPARLVVECFELEPLIGLRDADLSADLVLLMEHGGAPADESARAMQAGPRSYAWFRSEEGLDSLAGRVDGIGLDKRSILAEPGLVSRAHARGLAVLAWTLRPENAFLDAAYRVGTDPAAWGDWRAEERALTDAGVDGVFVDHPELYRAD